jgi:hypothetical protein
MGAVEESYHADPEERGCGPQFSIRDPAVVIASRGASVERVFARDLRAARPLLYRSAWGRRGWIDEESSGCSR